MTTPRRPEPEQRQGWQHRPSHKHPRAGMFERVWEGRIEGGGGQRMAWDVAAAGAVVVVQRVLPSVRSTWSVRSGVVYHYY